LGLCGACWDRASLLPGILVYAAMKAADHPGRTGFSALDFAVNCLCGRDEKALGAVLTLLRGYDEKVIKQELEGRKIVC
jgi:hypothetical protein